MRQLYDRNKLIAGLQRACEKTMMTELQFEELVARIEKVVFDQGDTEITSTQLGDIAMETLADTNQVAYLRFAIVYRNFKDLKSFEQELVKIQERIKTSSQK
jgi:transcriptional repressor NrdR